MKSTNIIWNTDSTTSKGNQLEKAIRMAFTGNGIIGKKFEGLKETQLGKLNLFSNFTIMTDTKIENYSQLKKSMEPGKIGIFKRQNTKTEDLYGYYVDSHTNQVTGAAFQAQNLFDNVAEKMADTEFKKARSMQTGESIEDTFLFNIIAQNKGNQN